MKCYSFIDEAKSNRHCLFKRMTSCDFKMSCKMKIEGNFFINLKANAVSILTQKINTMKKISLLIGFLHLELIHRQTTYRELNKNSWKLLIQVLLLFAVVEDDKIIYT
jgi:hypothetical protein